jgi:WD40 repeat protein
MDWTTPLRSQQADFIQRLKSDSAVFHHLNNSQSTGYHSELTVVSGKELEKILQYSLDIANKFKRTSQKHIRNEILDNFKGKLGELALKKYLDDLISPIDFELKLGGDQKVDFRLASEPSIGIQVKARHSSLDTVKWRISPEEMEKNAVLACIWIREKVNFLQPEYNLILAGFIPTNIIKVSQGEALVGIDELLYGGGLRSYLESLKSEHLTPDVPKHHQECKQIFNSWKSWECRYDSRLQHSQSVLSVAISPDGRTLASGSRDKTVKILDLDTNILRTTHDSAWVHSVAFSPDGQALATGSGDNTIKILHPETGSIRNTLNDHSGWIRSVAFSPDGQTLASGSDDKTIKIWHLGSGKPIRTLDGHSGSVYSVAFSPDGQALASGSDDKTIKIWHLGNGKPIRTLDGHSGSIYSVVFSPDGQTLASGSGDKTVKLWDWNRGKPRSILDDYLNSPHSAPVLSVAISPDGQILASGSRDKTIKIWHLVTGKLINTLRHSDSVQSVAFSPDGQTLVSGSCDTIISIWWQGDRGFS